MGGHAMHGRGRTMMVSQTSGKTDDNGGRSDDERRGWRALEGAYARCGGAGQNESEDGRQAWAERVTLHEQNTSEAKVAVAVDSGNAGTTDVGGATSRRDVRAKVAGGVVVDDGARGAGGVAVEGSMGVQGARSGGGGVWTKTGDAAGPCPITTVCGLISGKASITTLPLTDCIGSTTTATERAMTDS